MIAQPVFGLKFGAIYRRAALPLYSPRGCQGPVRKNRGLVSSDNIENPSRFVSMSLSFLFRKRMREPELIAWVRRQGPDAVRRERDDFTEIPLFYVWLFCRCMRPQMPEQIHHRTQSFCLCRNCRSLSRSSFSHTPSLYLLIGQAMRCARA